MKVLLELSNVDEEKCVHSFRFVQDNPGIYKPLNCASNIRLISTYNPQSRPNTHQLFCYHVDNNTFSTVPKDNNWEIYDFYKMPERLCVTFEG